MTEMLASVNSLEEALLIKSLAVDIIDLKQPAEGALGALPLDSVQHIVAAINGCKPVSATIGDLPMIPEIICPAVADMAATGVDYIKIGFFPGHDPLSCVTALTQLTPDHALVAVLFADCNPEFSLLPQLQQAGFTGVMLDTVDKSNGSLTDAMPLSRIEEFIYLAKQERLMSGLAGSLKSTDIPNLLPLQPDYLGFRGGLCARHDRVARLDPEKVANLSSYFHEIAITLTTQTLSHFSLLK